jgi:tRNA(adenine34) deaminase
MTDLMDFSVFSDEHYMKLAYQEAQKARDNGEIPVGAIIVCGQTIVAKAHNQTEILQDVTAHAEILAITAAANNLGAKYLTECSLFVTLEPCVMCAGAIFWSQLQRLVYGASDPSKGYTNYSLSASRRHRLWPPETGRHGKSNSEKSNSPPESGRHGKGIQGGSKSIQDGSTGKSLESGGRDPLQGEPQAGWEVEARGLLHPRTEVVSGLLAEPCGRLVEDFFRQLRN